MNTRFRTGTLLAVAAGALLASSSVSADFKRFEQQLYGGEARGQQAQSRGQRDQSRGQQQPRDEPRQSRNHGDAPRGQDRSAPPQRGPGGRQNDSHRGAPRPDAPEQLASRPPRDDTMRRGTPGRGTPAPRPDFSQPREGRNDHNETPPRFDGKVPRPDQPGRSWNGGNSWQDNARGGSDGHAGADRGRWNTNPVHRPNPVHGPGVVHRAAPRFVTSLPHGHRSYSWNGASYYHYGSHWYRPYGTRYVMVGAPYGLFVSYLPSYYSSFWFGGVHYYHADSTYYVYEPVRRGYVVSRSPYDDDVEEDAAYPGNADEDLYVYPAQGQSEQQQADDRYDCHRWAVDETGYDPIDSDYDADQRTEYTRALTACLTGRGYSVR